MSKILPDPTQNASHNRCLVQTNNFWLSLLLMVVHCNKMLGHFEGQSGIYQPKKLKLPTIYDNFYIVVLKK